MQKNKAQGKTQAMEGCVQEEGGSKDSQGKGEIRKREDRWTVEEERKGEEENNERETWVEALKGSTLAEVLQASCFSWPRYTIARRRGQEPPADPTPKTSTPTELQQWRNQAQFDCLCELVAEVQALQQMTSSS